MYIKILKTTESMEIGTDQNFQYYDTLKFT